MKFPFVISIPHCSSWIPEEVRPTLALTEEQVEESADIGTKEIFGSLPAQKVLFAEWSRLVVDLNRGSHERGPKGVIPHVDYYGRNSYRPGRFPDEREVAERVRKYYTPFHTRLKNALAGQDIRGLCDCHSLNGIGPREAPDAGRKRKDIVLGNNGDEQGNVNPALGRTTCPPKTLHLIKEAFEKAGFSVSINHPYSGGFITTHYGQECADKGKIAFQIEVNQDLYANPTNKQLVPERLDDVKSRVWQAFEEITKRL
ncbi:MAG: N-formylglutamate amidohydrolase [Desulfobacteraceae bacterium]|nr:N-formylglutamate amidohydrolase [Desulfobacteraceae bacterium]